MLYPVVMVGKIVEQVVREWCPSTTGPLLLLILYLHPAGRCYTNGSTLTVIVIRNACMGDLSQFVQLYGIHPVFTVFLACGIHVALVSLDTQGGVGGAVVYAEPTSSRQQWLVT